MGQFGVLLENTLVTRVLGTVRKRVNLKRIEISARKWPSKPRSSARDCVLRRNSDPVDEDIVSGLQVYRTRRTHVRVGVGDRTYEYNAMYKWHSLQ